MEESEASLLRRCFEGDSEALDVITKRHRAWLHRYVSRRLGGRLRALQDSEDVVQEVLVDLLLYGPRFLPANENQLRGLLGRMVLNRIRELDRYGAAACRELRRERPLQYPLDSGGISRIGPAEPSTATPDRRAQKAEERSLVLLARELLEPADREVIVLHQYQGKSFAEIAAELEIEVKAANKRYQRAVIRLGRCIRRVQTGELEDWIEEVRPFVDAEL